MFESSLLESQRFLVSALLFLFPPVLFRLGVEPVSHRIFGSLPLGWWWWKLAERLGVLRWWLLVWVLRRGRRRRLLVVRRRRVADGWRRGWDGGGWLPLRGESYGRRRGQATMMGRHGLLVGTLRPCYTWRCLVAVLVYQSRRLSGGRGRRRDIMNRLEDVRRGLLDGKHRHMEEQGVSEQQEGCNWGYGGVNENAG